MTLGRAGVDQNVLPFDKSCFLEAAAESIGEWLLSAAQPAEKSDNRNGRLLRRSLP
jgi:hypothetical protein